MARSPIMPLVLFVCCLVNTTEAFLSLSAAAAPLLTANSSQDPGQHEHQERASLQAPAPPPQAQQAAALAPLSFSGRSISSGSGRVRSGPPAALQPGLFDLDPADFPALPDPIEVSPTTALIAYLALDHEAAVGEDEPTEEEQKMENLASRRKVSSLLFEGLTENTRDDFQKYVTEGCARIAEHIGNGVEVGIMSKVL